MFDARAAKLLEPGGHITLEENPGLRLVASGTGKSWIYRYKSPVDGRMRQVKIGEWPAVSYPRAVVEWEDLRERRQKGEDVAAVKRTARQEVKEQAAQAAAKATQDAYTVARVCDDYWRGYICTHRAQKGVTEIRRLFDKELGPIAGIPAADLTRSQAFDLLQSLAERKPVIAGQLRTELGAAWDYAIDAGRLPEITPNWWRKILRGKLRSKGKKIAGENIGPVKRVLSEEEVGKLIRWLPNLSQLLVDALTLYLWTGCRGAEIVQMEGREISEEPTGWWWTIPKHKTKSCKVERATDLRVPLFGRAKEVVRRRKERHGDGFLFPSRNGKLPHIEQKTIQSSLFVYQPYSEIRPFEGRPVLPVSHWAPHDLRRTARTILASLGCPDAVGESILGHVPPGVLGVYNRHSYDKERAVWLARLSDHLEALAAA